MVDISAGTHSPSLGSEDPPSVRVRARVRTVALVMVAAGVFLAVAHLGVHTLAAAGILTYEGRLVGAFDMDAETSVPTWYSAVQLGGIALLLCVAALGASGRSERRTWGFLAVVAAYLALDESVALHESLMYATRNLFGITGGPLWYAWVIPVGVVLAVAAPFLVRFVLRLPMPVRALVIAACGLYVGGALGIEIVSASAGAEVESLLRDEFDPLVWALACFEESLEIAGLTVMAIAMMLYLRDHAPRGRSLGIELR